LNQCLRLFQQQEYEDERLGAHAKELLETLNKELGDEGANPELEEEGEEWEDEDGSDEDAEMDGA